MILRMFRNVVVDNWSGKWVIIEENLELFIILKSKKVCTGGKRSRSRNVLLCVISDYDTWNVIGILISGGGSTNEARSASEVYDVSNGQHCTLPSLPNERYGHTQVIQNSLAKHLTLSVKRFFQFLTWGIHFRLWFPMLELPSKRGRNWSSIPRVNFFTSLIKSGIDFQNWEPIPTSFRR